jgi:TolB protein
MLLRVYRFTDKIGIVILKVSGAISDWVITGFRTIIALLLSLFGGFFALLWGVLTTIAGGVLALLKLFARGMSGLLGLFSRGAQATVQASGSAVSSSIQSASEAMARRAAREEARDPVDVVIKEDPLRVQNRRLSALVIVLGVVVVGAVLWATDPNRQGSAPAAPNAGNIAALLPDATTVPDASNNIAAPLPTIIPTATAIPEALRSRGAIAYTLRQRGQTDLWVVGVGSRNPLRITNSPNDERDPDWNSTGTRLAYAARETGNWELYIYDLATQLSEQLTFDLAFQANPTWSPDNLWLAYEDYRGGNLDIYALFIDGTRSVERITDHPAPDFSPAWSPASGGREVAFTSWRDGNSDIFVINLNNREEVNITNTPRIDEDYAAWSPDGRYIAYSALEQGNEKVFVKDTQNLDEPAQVISFGHTPTWSPDGNSIAFAVDAADNSRTQIAAVSFREGVPSQVAAVDYGATAPVWSPQTLPPSLVDSGGLPMAVDALYIEQETRYSSAGAPFRLQTIGDVQNDPALLSDRVNDSFIALRQMVFEQSGVDFLGELDNTFWDLERPIEPGIPRRNWHMTGRAFSIARNRILGFPPPMEVMREDIGVDTYWRIYVRVDEDSQSGQLGEPLRQMPWDFVAATQGDADAYNQGGRLRREMPAGYYIDLTQLAQDYGWERLAAASDWRANSNARNYWMFVKDDDLEWYEAMQEIYPDGQIANFAPSS